jgi:hypothetical protein
MSRPKTVEEYVSLVDQAICEVDELRMSAEYDMDSLGGVLPFLDQLDHMVKDVRKAMADGSYQFEDKDLPFMELLEKADERVFPFKYMFKVINDTHRKGLDVEEL